MCPSNRLRPLRTRLLTLAHMNLGLRAVHESQGPLTHWGTDLTACVALPAWEYCVTKIAVSDEWFCEMASRRRGDLIRARRNFSRYRYLVSKSNMRDRLAL